MAPLSNLLSLLVELNDLKRITSAGRHGSVATRLFAQSWGALVAGVPAEVVAWRITAQAVAAARLGDIDTAVLHEAHIPAGAIVAVMGDSIDAVAEALPAGLRARLRDAMDDPDLPAPATYPHFVDRLAQQPRAGVTCPGKPRLLLEPPENHADHCLVVAVYAVLLAHRYEADPTRVFLAALAHHFHNALMPDSGFTGEVLLGPHLQTVMDHGTAVCLGQLPPPLRAAVEEARRLLPAAAGRDSQTFHAADVLDRVLQIEQYMRAAALTPARMLDEMELVHAGPVKAFQDDVLRQAGLL